MYESLPAKYERAFKPADIRGIYPTEIDETVAYRVGYLMVKTTGYKEIVVGSDMRLSTPALKAALVTGIRDAGGSVIDVGLVATPQLYYASGHFDLPGVMITASHSPKDYNGLKLVHKSAVPFTAQTGLSLIKKQLSQRDWPVAKVRGSVRKKSIDSGYIQYVLKGVNKKSYQGLRLAVDVGNGMAHEIIPLLRGKLPITFGTLFNTLDGRFPSRDADPNLRENQIALDAKLDHGEYDFGISFDGDADRIAFLDENGNYINSAAIGALIAYELLQKEPKAKLVSTTFNSRIFDETIKKQGGRVVLAKTGHTFLKEKMRQHDAVFGCEYSGHFFWRDFFYTDSVVLTLCAVLDAYVKAKASGLTFSQMMAPYLMYAQTEDVVVHVESKPATLKAVAEHLNDTGVVVKKFDGYAVDYGDVWGAIKESVTEYAVKCMFESTSVTKAKKKQKEIVAFLKSVSHLK